MTKINIRAYRDPDFPQLESVLKATKLYDPNFDQRERYKTKIEHDPESIIVAEQDNRILGGIIFIYDPFASSIWHLCVDPLYQGRGTGTELMKQAFSTLQSRGADVIIGYINADDIQLAQFYEKRGVKICRDLPIFGIEKKLDKKWKDNSQALCSFQQK